MNTRYGWARARAVRASAALGLILCTVCGRCLGAGQNLDAVLQPGRFPGGGWSDFSDPGFWLEALVSLLLAAGMGAILALHPRHGQTVDAPDDVETLQVYTIYAVVGAIVGMMVVRYGMVVGFVLFGIGGLIRFRTVLQSANRTGRVILVALIGLSCGLQLLHVAVLATVFAFLLFYLMDARVSYRMEVSGLDPEHFGEAASAYRELLGRLDCNVMSEKKNPLKSRLTYVFRCSRSADSEQIERALAAGIEPALRGIVNWEIT